MKEEAGEVVQAVGAWVYAFRVGGDGSVAEEAEKTLGALQDVIEAHAGYGAESVMLVVGMPPVGKESLDLEKNKREDWDDVAMQYGFEFVEYGAKGVNEFGEKQGMDRLKEALEANEWTDVAGDALGSSDADDDFGGFGREEAEMHAELFGVKFSLLEQDHDDEEGYGEAWDADHPDGNQELQVDDLDKMMSQLLAVREQSAGLPEAQRRRMAAQAVERLTGQDPNT